MKQININSFDLCSHLSLKAMLCWPSFSLSVSLCLILPSGLAVWASPLEGGSVSREPDTLGEPLNDPALPEPLPGRTRRHLRAGEQRRPAAPQRAADTLDAHLHWPATGEHYSMCPDREPQLAQACYNVDVVCSVCRCSVWRESK